MWNQQKKSYGNSESLNRQNILFEGHNYSLHVNDKTSKFWNSTCTATANMFQWNIWCVHTPFALLRRWFGPTMCQDIGRRYIEPVVAILIVLNGVMIGFQTETWRWFWHMEVFWNVGTPKSSMLDWDVPWNKPSSYWGIPFMETPYVWNTPPCNHPQCHHSTSPRRLKKCVLVAKTKMMMMRRTFKDV